MRYVILSNSSYASELGKDYEVLIAGELLGNKVDLHHLCEQELILRCPVFSAHDCASNVAISEDHPINPERMRKS